MAHLTRWFRIQALLDTTHPGVNSLPPAEQRRLHAVRSHRKPAAFTGGPRAPEITGRLDLNALSGSSELRLPGPRSARAPDRRHRGRPAGGSEPSLGSALLDSLPRPQPRADPKGGGRWRNPGPPRRDARKKKKAPPLGRALPS